mgnify:CR=1 FL=1
MEWDFGESRGLYEWNSEIERENEIIVNNMVEKTEPYREIIISLQVG